MLHLMGDMGASDVYLCMYAFRTGMWVYGIDGRHIHLSAGVHELKIVFCVCGLSVVCVCVVYLCVCVCVCVVYFGVCVCVSQVFICGVCLWCVWVCVCVCGVCVWCVGGCVCVCVCV